MILTLKNVYGCVACLCVCVSHAYSTEEGVALQLVVNHLVLGLKPKSSGRAASVLNPWGTLQPLADFYQRNGDLEIGQALSNKL